MKNILNELMIIIIIIIMIMIMIMIIAIIVMIAFFRECFAFLDIIKEIILRFKDE